MSQAPATPAPQGPGELIGPSFTDVAGDPGTIPQYQRLCSRYEWVSRYCDGRVVVEIACGTGQGLGLLARRAGAVIGGDYSDENLRRTRRTYGSRIPLTRLDAHRLPLRTASVDVLLLLETIYFLPSPAAFVAEAVRCLRPGGVLLISTINKDCWDFNPSPLYPAFFGAPELHDLLTAAGLEVECFGAFPLDRPSLRQRFFRPIKEFAVRHNLIPNTVQARRWLKRIAIGKLVPLPVEIHPGMVDYAEPRPIPPRQPDAVHQVVMAAGRVPASVANAAP